MSLRFCVERNGLWLQIASWGVGNVAPAVILNESIHLVADGEEAALIMATIQQQSKPNSAPAPVQQQITIDHGGTLYGPYESRTEALKDGFHLPEET